MYRNILVPVDLSDKHSWRKALPTAISLCETFQGKLHLMTVVPEFGLPMVGQFFPEGYEAKLRQHAAKQLRDFAAQQVPGEIECRRIVAEGKVYQEILKAADAIKADLVVMGSHRPELSDYLLGPNAARVTRHARCSVMVVRE
ncbi:MAG: universal stress protein [Geminicoccaceae bacterium]|jgi:nucleotide-binding universal stress UspA family protein|nr:universal stress protein [Geminicoccaceae bacterium]